MNEQQRHADWAAVHQPQTSTEELSRIAREHPEFMPAVMAHQNAPGASSQSLPQATPSQTHSPAYTQAANAHHPMYATTGPTNKLAFAAAIVAAASALSSFIYPFIVQSMIDSGATAAIGFVNGAIAWFFIIATAVLAILALRKGQPTRGRWAAHAALGVAGASVLGFLASTVGSLASSFLYYGL